MGNVRFALSLAELDNTVDDKPRGAEPFVARELRPPPPRPYSGQLRPPPPSPLHNSPHMTAPPQTFPAASSVNQTIIEIRW
jgi:hypothetical protein